MSYAQQRLWFLNRLEGPNATFNAPLMLRLRGALDRPALRMAWRDVLRRHESLRTRFTDAAGEPEQIVLDATEPELALTVTECAATELDAILLDLQTHPFDLGTELPVRARLVSTGAEEHVLALVLHHIVSDGWSIAPLLRDLGAAYTARTTDGTAPAWEPLPVQYADYTLWQRDLLGDAGEPGSLADRQLDHWRTALAGLPEELELPADRSRPAVATHRGGQVRFALDPEVAAGLRALAHSSGSTLFMVLQAGLAGLLTRLGAGTDIPLGTVVAGRTDEALDDLVGFFVNTLVLRTDTSGDPTFEELLARVRATDLAAYDHQDIPFERLVEELNPVRSRSRHPLVQVSVELHTVTDDGADLLPGLECTELPADLGGIAKLDLTWDFFESGDSLGGELAYAEDLFDRETGERLVDWLQRLLAGAAAAPGTRLSELSLVSAQERRVLLRERHRVQHEDLEKGVVDRVREHAAARPGAPAVTDAHGTVDYATLVGRASAIGRRLRPDAAAPRGFVAVLADRGAAVVSALLGVLGAGCAYFPLDTRAPLARNAARLDDTRAGRLLTDARHADTARELAGRAGHPVEVIVLDGTADPMDSLAPVLHGPDDLAYTIFTSGSTGRPKGAMVKHRGLVNNLLGEAEAIGIADASHVVASSAPLTFDISVWQMLTALVFGGAVHAVDDATARDPRALFRTAVDSGMTVLQVVPSLLQAALDEWDAQGDAPAELPLRKLAVTGEALPGDVARRWLTRYPGIPLVNCYGPTECSDDVTQAVITAGTVPEGARTPIGVATRGMTLYVLDERLGLAPMGVPGELYIGGVGVGLGYLDDPGRTATTFVPDPFSPDPGSRMYRTGDVVRYRRDGQLEFLGRQDHQVKIRGQRIELGEVEFALRRLDGVRDAVVAVVTGAGGHRVLVGYYIGDVDPADARAALAAVLSDGMVPSVLVPMDAFPLTPNGKLDRKALPAPDLRAGSAGRAPRTPREKELCQVFEETLGVDGIGLDDGFFDLGGHSLLAIRLMRTLNRRLGASLPLSAVFERQTPGGLAELLAGGVPSTGPDPVDLTADVRLDAGIRPEGPVAEGPPRHVLLTGATGFLGAYILRETLDRTDATVHCLVRAADDAAAMRRIERGLTGFGLWEEELRGRVVPLAGDLGEPLLGLGAERFDALARTVDLVLHNGSRVNLMESYERLRPANVDGVREILRLAALHRTKPVHYVSTISTVVAGDGDPEVLPENWVSDPALVDPYGYVRSKWVAEGIVRLGQERGIPTAVYRPSRIGGDSMTGAVGSDDAFWHYVRACVELGARPDAGVDGGSLSENIVPVDYTARAFVHLALAGRPEGTVYSLVSPTPVELSAVLDHAEGSGYPMETVPYEEWRRRLALAAASEPAAEGSSVHAVALLDSTAGETPGRYPDAFDRTALEAGLEGSGLRCPEVDRTLLERYFGHFIRTGFLPTPRPAAVARP
ncbi:amino acid adenylation domain-containing protein [Streptomyces sp. NPDC047971]|uniref:non-ribosomal peptide synthetase family protein n=1 Tax=Streptomyces sp. NPDC047971 TaxID=3154499 RepID=UPI0033F0AABA